MSAFRSSIIILVASVWVLNANARIINIPDDHESIQAGIVASEDGDTVLVHPGRYVENVDFIGRAITLASLFLTTGEKGYIDSTIIDGDQNGSSVVRFTRGEDETSVMTGLTVTNGWANYGSGIYISGSSPTLSHLVITSNTADRTGGGMHCTSGASPTISHVIISDNQSRSGGGGISCYNNATPTVTSSRIIGNLNPGLGGGILCGRGSEITVDSCEIVGNTGFTGGAVAGNWGVGGAIHLNHTIIADNSAGSFASGIYCVGMGSLNLTNVTYCHNYQDRTQIHCDRTTCTIVNSILWDIGEGNVLLSRLNVLYSDIEGGMDAITIHEDSLEWGEGVLNDDPRFADPEAGDFRLLPNSPCIDTGDPEADPDPDGSRADIGALCFHHWDFEVEPEMLEFVDVQTGLSDSLAVTCRNLDEEPCQVRLRLICAEDSSFAVGAGGCEFSLEPDSSHVTWVTFTPETDGEYRAILRVESLDPDAIIASIPVIGAALNIRLTGELLPTGFALHDAFPNPFNSSTVISFTLAKRSVSSLSIYNISGQCISVLKCGLMPAGQYKVVFNADSLPCGVYIAYLSSSGKTAMKKLLLLK